MAHHEALAMLDGGRVRIDTVARQLIVEGQAAKLGSRAFDLLLALLDRRDRVVSKQELLDVVWPGLVVEENNLQVQVVTLRKLLGPQAIATVSGRGYRLALAPDIGPAVPGPAPVARPAAVEPDTLIGRDDLAAAAADLLADPTTRLLTLTGPGGAGKTRLALRVSGQRAAALDHGAYVVMLAPVREVEHLMGAIALALGLQESGAVPLAELVLGFLAPRSVLLVLDNLEHLPGAAAPVARLLSGCPHLQLLATSRAVLGLAEERVLEVMPLALPLADSPEAWRSSPAVMLFAARARTLGRDVSGSDEMLHAAAQICRRLDGLPLAIELAAARLRVLTPQALAVRLQQALPMLTGNATDAPQRQQTLRETIAWSHDLLDEPTRALFARLSVFVGGWSIEAAEAVAERPSPEVVDALQSLLAQHLVQRIDDVGDEPRYTMLETVREFAKEALDAAGGSATARRLHACFHLSLAEALQPAITSPRRASALLKLRAEANNFRAALDEMIHRRADADTALRLVAALAWVWYFDGRYREGRRWIEAALALPGAQLPTPALASALSGAARLAAYSAALDDARALCDRSLALWRADGDRRGLAWVLMLDGVTAIQSGDGARGERSLAEAISCFRDLQDPWGLALAVSYLGSIHAVQPGHEAIARPLLLEGRARFQALGDDWGLTISSHYLGSLALRGGQLDEARRLTEEMLANASELGDPFRIARNLHQLAEIDAAQGHLPRALDLLGRSLRLNVEHQRLGDQSQQLRLAARLAERLGQDASAALLAGASEPHAGAHRSMPPDDMRLHETLLERLRSRLGDAALAEARLQGQVADVDRLLRVLRELCA